MVRGWRRPSERTSRDGLRRIPDKVVVVGSRSRRTEVRNLQITVIDEPLVVLRHTAAHTIISHRDRVRSLSPQHRAVLAVVGDLPGARRGFDERLVAVGVVLRNERINRHILVEVVRRVGGVHVAFRRSIAVADVIEVVAVAVGGVNRGSRVGELTAGVVAIVDGIRLLKGRTRLRTGDTATGGVVGVGVLGDRTIRKCIVHLEQFATVAVGPGCGQSVRIGERGFQIRIGQIIPAEFRSGEDAASPVDGGVANAHGRETACNRIVGECRLADAVEGVARVASEGVVEALDGVGSRDTDDGFVRERTEGVVGEGRDTGGIDCAGLASHRVVGEGHSRSVVGVGGGDKIAPGVVGVSRVNAARPGALREAAVSIVVIRRALAVRINLVGHCTGGDVV